MQLHRAYDGGDWIYGTCFQQDENESSIWWYIDEHDESWMVGKPEPCTGEKDKNGRDVFLNDIVKHKVGTGVICYGKGEYYIDWQDGIFHTSRLCMLENTYEVIGNLTEEKL